MKNKEDSLLYMQLYDTYKNMILSGMIKPGTRLESVRKCAETRRVSRTTVEMAYMLLAADGYIISKPQSGFYVSDMWSARPAEDKKKQAGRRLNPEKENEIFADFSNTSSGQESFDLERWRRYIKSALRQGDRLLTYGDAQGEPDLREVLCDYLVRTRNVVCSPESIVIGAGFQSLLHILCPLLEHEKQVYFSDPGFVKGQAVFEDYGFETSDAPGEQGIWYVTPSHINRMCQVMDLRERYELLARARQLNMLLIEDDYDSEFINLSHSVPSIQGLAGGQQVVYLGTFSRVLLPSIRISFMILPPDLLDAYRKRRHLYNQTVSKADQIALCQYIRDGHLMFQIRKTRKAFEEENALFYKEMRELLPSEDLKRTGQVVRMRLVEETDEAAGHSVSGKNTGTVRYNRSGNPIVAGRSGSGESKAARLCAALKKKGVLPGIGTEEDGSECLYFSGSSVKGEERRKAFEILKKVLEENARLI